MGLSEEQIANVKVVLKSSLRRKFQNYNPEPASMPFHTRLLGKDRLALYSFIHSLSTNFGTAIFEPVAETIAKDGFKTVKTQTIAGEHISEQAQFEIQKIIDNLTTATAGSPPPNKVEELKAIRKVCQTGSMRKVKPTRVDLFLETLEGELYLFDIKNRQA